MGKSACGKSTIEKELSSKLGYNRIVTYTTRPKRDNETDGVDYNFVSKSRFNEMNMNGEFIETRKYNTFFGLWDYGTAKHSIDLDKNDYVVTLAPKATEEFINYFGAENCIVFYIYAPKYIREHRARLRPNFNESEWERRCTTDYDDFNESTVCKLANFKITNVDVSINNIIRTIKTYVKIWKA